MCRFRIRPLLALTLLSLLPLFGGCDMLGIESSEKVAAARDADGRAVGSACRHAARAIEDCYAMNKKADKAAIFAGWREMNDYMRENKMDSVPPQVAARSSKPHGDDDAAPAPMPEHDAKTAAASPDEHAAKPAAEAEHAAPKAMAEGEHVAPKAVAEAKTGKEGKPE